MIFEGRELLKNRILDVISERILEKLKISKNHEIEQIGDSGAIDGLNSLGYYSREIFSWVLS